MNTRPRWYGLLTVLCSALLLSACAAEVRRLNPPGPIPAKPAGLPFEAGVGVESLRGDPRADVEAKKWQGNFGPVLRKENIFTRVDEPYRSDALTNLLLRGSVTGKFRGGYGFLNFLTWFPGPFVFMHNWRGTRFGYETRADVELVEADTKKVVNTYTVNTVHKLIHRSSNPGPVFAAMVIIPGLVKAIGNTWPRQRYRRMMYEKAYGDLWQLMSVRIATDRARYYADRREERRKHCGDRLGAEPVVGTTWKEFEACQTSKYVQSGQETSDAGTVTVYLNADRSLEIHVVDGRIVRWSEGLVPGE